MKRCFCLAIALLASFFAHAQTNHSFVIAIGEKPIITDNDIIEYRFAEHAMVVKGESRKRLAEVRPKNLSGTSFRVIADGASVYGGLFVPAASSMTYDEPTIWVRGGGGEETATVYICGAHFQDPRFQKGNDPRGDIRITRTLGALGKLKPGNPGSVNDPLAFTEEMGQILDECRQLRPGKTRADLLKVFTTEGGVSSAKERTYVHQHCPYIKVDVRFDLTNEKQSVVEELPTDKIISVSKPYLAWSVAD